MNQIIHPTALLATSVVVARGVAVGPFSIIRATVAIKEGAQIGAHCELGGAAGRVVVGPNARLKKGCWISGDVVIGEGAVVGENVVIEGGVRIGAGVLIAEQASLRGTVTLGEGTTVGPGSVLTGNVTIGAETRVFNHCSIGADPQHPGSPAAKGYVEIGRRCVLREFTTVHAPTTTESTRLGDACYIMAGCHINHDCELGADVKMANAATLAGHVKVGEHSYLGMHSLVHQWKRIGPYAMIGMNATVNRHVPPYATVIGRHFTKINRRGLEIRGVPTFDIDAIETYYRCGVSAESPESPWVERIRIFESMVDSDEIMSPAFASR